MSIYLSNLILILFLIYIYRTNRHGLHILQLEHYYTDRYVKWMKENANTIFDVKKVGLLFLSSLYIWIRFYKSWLYCYNSNLCYFDFIISQK